LTSEDEALDLLYGLPLSDFTARRNALAKELRASGNKGLAALVQKAPKPTVPAWAINQLARGDDRSMQSLLELQERMAAVDSAAELRKLSSERRELVNELTHSAERLLAEAGHPATSTTKQQISQTLLAGATDEERELLAKGRLTRELSSTGLEQAWGLGAFDVPEVGDEEAAQEQDDAAARRHAEEVTKRAREARREAERLAMAAEEARAYADRAEEKAKQAAEGALVAEEEAAEARRGAGLVD
jgi:hypothetical protein